MPQPPALDASLLHRPCDPELLDLTPAAPADLVGQSRALEAVRFGIDIRHPGFNLFVLGRAGSGRHAAVRGLIEGRAATEPPPSDWCYVNNFAEPNQPRLLRLPTGRAAGLKHEMQAFGVDLSKAINSAFEADEYRARIEALQESYKDREEGALRELGRESGEKGVALLRTPHGFVFAPLKGGEPMPPDEFAQLPEAERARIAALMEEFGERLQKTMRQFPRWRRELQDRIREANRETLQLAVGHLIDDLRERLSDLPGVLDYLGQVMRDIVEVGDELREQPKGEGESAGTVFGASISLTRYQANPVVDHAVTRTAPVVFEDNPTYPNLVGRVDQVAHMGMLVTNFTFIRAGALQRANGGYLMLDAAKLLVQPYAWEGLKRALRAGQVRIESLGQVSGFGTTLALEPEPMPLDVKVVLFGERMHYYLLRELDPEFGALFKVAADFEDTLPRTPDNTRRFAGRIVAMARDAGLRAPDAGAVARVVEHAARLAGDAERLSASLRQIDELLQEADHCAAAAGRATIARDDVDAALSARRHRAGRVRELAQEQILRGNQLISVEGSHVGQANGLAVVDLGDFPFAHPVRITATARIGDGEVIDIEREAELGGPLHSKGVMILSAFLASRYARSLPLSLNATLVFEQSYGPVEGDSASLAELCALLSALAGAPIRQSFALTGSVNQYGRVQAIGAVSEKIEGFFDLCAARGLTGEQGVLIPADNVKHLMLREEVVAACAAGRFRVHAVEDVDQAIELLTGIPAGEPDEAGRVPEGTLNYLVAAELAEMSALRQAFAGAGRRRGSRAGAGKAAAQAISVPLIPTRRA